MSKKYELIKEDIIYEGSRKLYRIRSLRKIGYSVKEGTLGGYVQSEDNLSQEGESWIGYHAKAYDRAKVLNDAAVMGHAEIFGDATIKDDALLLDNAHLYGNATVGGHARIENDSLVKDDALIIDHAEIKGAIICGNAIVKDFAIVRSGEIYGNAIIREKADIRNWPEIGFGADVRYITDYLVVGGLREEYSLHKSPAVTFFRTSSGGISVVHDTESFVSIDHFKEEMTKPTGRSGDKIERRYELNLINPLVDFAKAYFGIN